MKRRILRAFALVLVACLPAGLLAVPTTVAAERTDRTGRTGALPLKRVTKEIAPGLTLTKYIDKKTPRRTYVLTVDLSTDLTYDVTLARGVLPGRLRTSDIAGREGAIAAVNGDFTDPNAGRPVHPFQQDGLLAQTSINRGIAFAVSSDEQTFSFAQPQQVVTATVPGGLVWTIDRWNQGPPGVGEIAAFSPLGGTLELPPPDSCSVRLLPQVAPSPSPIGPGMEQTFTVDERTCSESSLPRNGGVVLSALPASDEAMQILSLVPGSTVTLDWSLGWSNTLDVIGGSPLLVADGKTALTDCTTSLCHRAPRTGIGVTADGKLLLVVVDGRRPTHWSVGATLKEFARIFLDLGATWALNLDGGGASTMVVNGAVVNRPSDTGGERGVASAVLILPGPDPGQP